MNVWAEESKPEVICTRTVLMALVIHCAAFVVFWLFAKFNFRPKETVIPIDLTVVVNENLDGKENEPPPLDDPVPEKPQPKPKPKPVPKEDPAPPVQDAVIREKPEKKKPEKKKPEEKKKDEPKKEDPPKKEEPKVDPKKLAEEKKKAREKRLEEIRSRSKATKPVKIKVKDQPSGDGKTTKKTLTDDEIRKLLDQGYKPGSSNQLTADDRQRCVSLIRRAFYDQWESPAWNPTLKEMILSVRFDKNGKVLGYQFEKRSGDKTVDNTVLAAAAKVPRVHGLSTAFLEAEHYTVSVRFTVECR